jgi:outer membrane protein OmpA-like peptidoglycan-associated protein
MRTIASRGSLVLAVLALAFALPLSAQEPAQRGSKQETQKSTGTRAVALGQKLQVEGVVVKRAADSLTLRDQQGQDLTVTLTNITDVKERKSNPFRRARNYATTQLLRGLSIEVKGQGDNAGTLVATEIKIKEDDLRVAQSIESRVTPVEGRVTESETRLTQAESNAQRLSGQVDELQAISNAARGGAKAAQETADAARERAEAAHTAIRMTGERVDRVNTRITSLDDFDIKTAQTVHFKAGSAVLSPEAKETLDQVAEAAKRDKGYMIEVTGFASSDGNEDFNRRLSQRRADAVIRYLAENHEVPLRRVITPFGYGEKMPVADNKSRDGRIQNRRVEIKILVNRGLTASAESTAPSQD